MASTNDCYVVNGPAMMVIDRSDVPYLCTPSKENLFFYNITTSQAVPRSIIILCYLVETSTAPLEFRMQSFSFYPLECDGFLARLQSKTIV